MIEVRVVCADLRLGSAGFARCQSILDAEERERAARFLRETDRQRFVASHAALRVVLGRALDLPPRSIQFAKEPTGRPYLLGGGVDAPDFNLSHSGDHALIGLVRGARIGTDVEVWRPLPDALRIARAHFASDEIAALAALPATALRAAFFSLWTRKEAVVKAIGAGLLLPLSDFTVTVPPDPPALLRIAGAADRWTLRQITLGADVSATIAVTANPATLRIDHLAGNWANTFDEK
ncbi:MAG: 4'-phosphopantetheinyl transferase superfamily protein [Parafilimonas terrae]|nr:4'-phosphopantetheinyl transferase superfamily protein [Parafilimonas terrae]